MMESNRLKKTSRLLMIIAELSANHGQKEELALELIRAAYEAGADAVKVQTYTPDTLTFRSDSDAFVIKDQPLWKGLNLWDLYQQAYTPWEWQPKLKHRAEQLGMRFIASVFDFTSVDFWEEHGLDIYKIASAEIIDIPLLKYVAATGKMMIVSTGMATLEEIEEAVQTIREVNPDVDLTLLKCSSAYPSPIEEMNLRGIQTLQQHFKVRTGLSDHSLDDEIAITSVGLGATVFEKHLKLDHGDPPPDDAFSLTPARFAEWVRSIRKASLAMGSSTLLPTEHEKATLPFRKSLFVVKDMLSGEAFTPENVRSIRPSIGLHPRNYESVMGKMAAKSIAAGTPLSRELIQP
jgi:pseudaminic acid synthase